MDSSKRNISAQSIVKGLLITSVIYFHATMLMALPNPTSVLYQFEVLHVLFPFLMMVFFFYAGYNYTPGKRTIGQNIKRRSFQLLIPMGVTFIVASLLVMAIRVPTGESLDGIKNGILYSLMSEPLSLMIGFPFDGGPVCFDLVLSLGILWFLYALYIVSIFFYLIVDFAIKNLKRLIPILVGLLLIAFSLGQFVGVYLPYTVQCYPVALAIMLLAAYLKQTNFLERKIESKKDAILTVSITVIAEGIIVAIGLVSYYVFGSTMVGSLPGGKFDDNLKGFDAFLAFIIGFLGTYVIHQISRLIKLVPVASTVLDWYGRRSAYVYLTHPIILCFIHHVIFLGERKVGEFQPYLYTFMTIAILVLIFIGIDFIISKVKLRKVEIVAA